MVKTTAVALKQKAEVVKIQVPQVLVEKFEKLGVSEEEASVLLTNFGVPLNEVGPILETYLNIKVETAEDTEAQALARTTRLQLKKIRTGVENTRVDMKAEFLRKGDAIQAVANYIRDAIQPAETYLQEQEDFIKVQEEKAQADRIAKRTEVLVALEADPSIYSLGDMSEDAFESLITGIKDANEAKIAREKATKDAEDKLEAERVAHEQELAAENAKLKAAQADADEKAAVAQRNADALLAAEKAKTDALAKAVADKEALEASQKAEALKAEQEAEAAKQAAQKAASLAPDKEKLVAFADGLMIVVNTRLPQVQSAEAKEQVLAIEKALTTFSDTIKERAGNL
ncbi:MAG: hypothetical protein ACOH18_05505 [Candidatus Saccharimonadaceae bacterium]